MQVTETLSQGLKREYNIVLSASDLASRLDAQLADLKTKVKINGFRPGKVPVAHLKRVYGRSVMSDVVQEAINSANKQIVDDNGLRLAQEPKIELPTDKDAIEAALEARGDLDFKVALEVLPKFEVGEFSDLTLERPVADVEESEVEAALQRLAQDRRVYSDKPEGAKAENFDRVTVDFVGTIKGEPFEGGASEGIEVVLGSNTFIPGFEEQLLGAVAGERRAVQATFPEAYAVRKLAGQKADFDVTVKAVAAPEPFAVDDEFAKSLGAESLDQIKQTLRERIRADYARASREKVKRKLLDALAARYSFEVPEGLVRSGVRLDLGAGRARAAGLGPHVRRRKHHRGGGARGISRHRRAARSLGAAARRSRRQGGRQDQRRGNDAGARRARPRLPRPGKTGLGLLPQQSAGAGRTAGAHLRGKGRRPHPRPRQGRGPQGDGQGTAASRRRRSRGEISAFGRRP